MGCKPNHGSVFAFTYCTLVPAWVGALHIALLLRCKWYTTTRTAMVMSSTIPHTFNVERSNDDWSQTFICGDMNLWSQSDDVFRGSVRLRKLLPLKCNGSEQLQSEADVSKYMTCPIITNSCTYSLRFIKNTLKVHVKFTLSNLIKSVGSQAVPSEQT